MDLAQLSHLLGDDAQHLLHDPLPAGAALVLPGPDWVDRAWGESDRSPAVLCQLQRLFDAGRLAATGHLCVLDLRVRDGCAPEYLDIGNAVELAIEGGCSAVLATPGTFGTTARRHAHRIPLIAALSPDADPRSCRDLGAAAVYVESPAEPVEVSESHATHAGLLDLAHREGLATVRGGVTHAPGADLVIRAPVPQTRRLVQRLGLGRIGLLSSTHGDSLRDDIRHAVVNKRAGGVGVVVGQGVLRLPREEGVAALHAVQDVYRCGAVTVG